MRSQIVWSTLVLGLALGLGACEELNVDDEEHADTGDDTGGGGGPGGGGPSDDDDDDDIVEEDDEPVDDSSPPHVSLDSYGRVEGIWGEHGVRQFLGIPYAKAPTGDLRWAAPQRADSWDGDLKATQLPRACPGAWGGAAKGDKPLEDCLYLNVWAPSHVPSGGLPVMVWFHGGDHVTGSASEKHPDVDQARYDGKGLAANDVVVVTINYRLGPLGFLPIGAKKAKPSTRPTDGPLFGNQGLWDQAFALQWVQDNIGEFGGDPDNVTIFGQGSGAVDVCLHMVSPHSGGKDLFHQAISQSGSCTRLQRTSEALYDGLDPWLDKLDCNASDREEVASCLRGKSVAELFDAVPDIAAARKWFGPSVDGHFVPDQPRTLFESQDVATVPYLIGSNGYEASVLEVEDLDSEAAYHKALARLFPSATDEQRCEAYPHDAYADAKKPYRTALAHVLADGAYGCAALHTAGLARAAGSTVYAYHFTGPDGSEATAAHGGELDYVFGTKDVPERGVDLREAVQHYWTTFASDGDPGAHDGVDWPQLGQKPRKLLRLGAEREVVSDLRKAQCALWEDVYDAEWKPKATTPTAAATPKDETPPED